MKTYGYKHIDCIIKAGITSIDGHNIMFEECRKEWWEIWKK